MSRYLLTVKRKIDGALTLVPIGELALLALTRMPDIEGIQVTHQTRTSAELSFWTSSSCPSSTFASTLETFGLVWVRYKDLSATAVAHYDSLTA
ncbi:hypothetical protein [Lysobacter sp. Hz 25]|uniref:hypothetical protein n=1 Tax=Lysobacter sp. Hz 25 TaxID=3383698 RepID=UPI0038D4F95C